MKKLLFALTLLTTLSFAGFAQTQPGIRGSVNDGEKPIEAASISLLKSKDSALVKMLVTDKSGKF
jgi:iron complex outermembrane recepter protein